MNIIIGILAFVFALGIIVLVHEGGHFLFARRAKILCREFAFGMGPLLWQKKKGETVYALRAFPIGGACVIAGEELEADPLKGKEKVKLLVENGLVKKIYVDIDNDLFTDIPIFNIVGYDLYDINDTGVLYIDIKENENIQRLAVDCQALYVFVKKGYNKNNDLSQDKKEKKYAAEYQIAPHNRVLNSKTKRARAMVMFGGPMMNFILAIIVFFIAGLVMGFSDLSSTTLNEVSDDTPAYAAGLREGDKILNLKTIGTSGSTLNKDINEWNDITTFMQSYRDDTQYASDVTVKYERNGTIYNATIRPMVVIYSVSMIQDFQSDAVKVGELDSKSKAYKAGIREGDIIVSIDSKVVTTWKEVYNAFNDNKEAKEMKLKLKNSANEEREITITPYSEALFEKTQNIGIVGIAMGVSPVNKFSFGKSFLYAGEQMGASVVTMVNTLGMLFASKEVGVGDLSGPIGIFSMTSNAAKQGFGSLLYWVGFLSVNVGLMNLLPIPALDGGRLVFLGYEAITKKRVSEKVETALISVTFILLMALMVYVSFNDILRLVGVR